jgi:hypothetical protein
MNSSISRAILEWMNPTICFQVGDVVRLPLAPIADAQGIFEKVAESFDCHEATREPSVEFRCPGPSAWTYAQVWAQLAVDRSEGAPLRSYEPVYDPAAPESFVSFAIGVALGRFGANGEGILDEAAATALPSGVKSTRATPWTSTTA